MPLHLHVQRAPSFARPLTASTTTSLAQCIPNPDEEYTIKDSQLRYSDRARGTVSTRRTCCACEGVAAYRVGAGALARLTA